MNTLEIENAISYLKKFVGMPYVMYDLNNPPLIDSEEPFWISNKEPPSIKYIYKRGSVCVGLINLLRRYMGLEIPGMITGQSIHIWPGGTSAWFKYLNNTNRLSKIDRNLSYPIGTLLIQDFNPEDQGHVAVIITEENNLLNSKIIHNINGTWNNKNYNSVVIEKLKEYPFNERFTHICRPNVWILKN